MDFQELRMFISNECCNKFPKSLLNYLCKAENNYFLSRFGIDNGNIWYELKKSYGYITEDKTKEITKVTIIAIFSNYIGLFK